jgi:hypothetical protein
MANEKYNTELGIYQPHCGLENVKFAYGHDEYMYQMMVSGVEVFGDTRVCCACCAVLLCTPVGQFRGGDTMEPVLPDERPHRNADSSSTICYVLSRFHIM